MLMLQTCSVGGDDRFILSIMMMKEDDCDMSVLMRMVSVDSAMAKGRTKVICDRKEIQKE